MDYVFDPTPSTLKVTALNIKPVDTQTGQTYYCVGQAYPTEPLLGQTFTIENTVAGVSYTLSTTGSGVLSQDNSLAGLPTISITDSDAFNPTVIWGNPYAVAVIAGYVLPYSSTINPAGYTYQTLGSWLSFNTITGVFSEFYTSVGAPTVAATLPVAGTASYSGQAAGSLIDAVTRDPGDITATVTAIVDFANNTVAFATTGTTSLSNNASLGTLPSTNPGLDISGTLSYGAGSNIFTGTVTNPEGMSGNATCIFYGPTISVATTTKALGSPPEIGCTFAIVSTGVEQYKVRSVANDVYQSWHG